MVKSGLIEGVDVHRIERASLASDDCFRRDQETTQTVFGIMGV